MSTEFIEKTERLGEPVVSAGDRVYCISSQNGLFPDPWGGHVPHEGWGVWDHPIKLLDGFWFGLRPPGGQIISWLGEAIACRVYPGYTEFDYDVQGLIHVTRRDFVPDGVEGMVSSLEVDYQPSVYDRQPPMQVVVMLRSDLRPAWHGEDKGMIDGTDSATIAADQRSVVFHDANNPWTAVVGVDARTIKAEQGPNIPTPQQTTGQGANAIFYCDLNQLDNGKSGIKLFIAGSTESEQAAQSTFRWLKREHGKLFAAKQEKYAALGSGSKLTSPDAGLDEAFYWVKINNQMLARYVPEHGLGVGAGLPTYPWWFGLDTEYTVLPLLQAGMFELAKESVLLIMRASQKANSAEPGRVIHELTTVGVVENPGNLVETPLFVRAAHQCWLWTGDRAFLDAVYPFCRQGLLEYTLGKNDPDGDLCASGRSLIETLAMHAGFECIDIAAYTWEAMNRLCDMARTLGDTEIMAEVSFKADQLGKRITEEWWIEQEGMFADVRASVNEVNQRLGEVDKRAAAAEHPDATRQAEQGRADFEPALSNAANSPQDQDLPWLLRHWIVMCPIEVGLASRAQAERALTRLESPEFSGVEGMYLHPDRHESMSINTGVLALAEARYGRMEQALRYIHNLTDTLTINMPGAISEALPNKWCFIQLWSALGVISPVVDSFLGVSPRAGEGRIRVTPQLPAGWDHAELSKLRIGDCAFDIAVQRNDTTTTVRVNSDKPSIKLQIGCYLPADADVDNVTLNGEAIEWKLEQNVAGRCVVCDARGNAELVVTTK